MDEELQIKQQLTSIPFHMLLKADKQNPNHSTRLTEELPKKIKGGPEVRDARKPIQFHSKISNENKHEIRDPRFDTTAGDLSLNKFYKSYDFLTQLKNQEIQTLDKAAKKLNKEQKSQVKQIIGKSKDELKKREQMLKKDITIKQLKKPNFHPKKSMIKNELLKQKYNELEASGKLDTFIKQKKKSLAKKLDFASKRIKK